MYRSGTSGIRIFETEFVGGHRTELQRLHGSERPDLLLRDDRRRRRRRRERVLERKRRPTFPNLLKTASKTKLRLFRDGDRSEKLAHLAQFFEVIRKRRVPVANLNASERAKRRATTRNTRVALPRARLAPCQSASRERSFPPGAKSPTQTQTRNRCPHSSRLQCLVRRHEPVRESRRPGRA